jgi:hypothetical protein
MIKVATITIAQTNKYVSSRPHGYILTNVFYRTYSILSKLLDVIRMLQECLEY